jgi:predicted amidophosphoribosyltransferase
MCHWQKVKLIYALIADWKCHLPTSKSFRENPVEKMFNGRVHMEFATSLLFFTKGEKVQHILHNIKYNEQKELAIYLGRIFGKRLQNNPYLKDVTTIIPVPLHPKKQQLRGYNQTELFIDGMNEDFKC